MELKKRAAIFVFYNKNGLLTRDVEFLLQSLKQAAGQVIVVINGSIRDYDKIKLLADFLLVRENKGYDAGAYKEALFNKEVNERIKECEQLIFCNDTFYGPFVPFDQIWSVMDELNADFWGLNLSNSGSITFLQSYFLVFRRKVWNALKEYFYDYIDENTLDFQKVLISFERGLFSFLVRKGYTYGAYRFQRFHIFRDVDGSVCIDRLPLLKKKAFSAKYYDRHRIMNALKYIDNNYCYDIKLILEDIEERNSIILHYDEIKEHQLHIRPNSDKVNVDDIILFSERFQQVYVYGTGAYGKMVKDIVDKSKIAGFIVSDDQKHSYFDEDFYVYGFSEFKRLANKKTPIIVALNAKNKNEVQGSLQDFANIWYLV